MTPYDDIWSEMSFWHLSRHLEVIYNIINVMKTFWTQNHFQYFFSIFVPYHFWRDKIGKNRRKIFFLISNFFVHNGHNMTWYVCRLCFTIQRTCFGENKSIVVISGHFSANYLKFQKIVKIPKNTIFAKNRFF